MKSPVKLVVFRLVYLRLDISIHNVGLITNKKVPTYLPVTDLQYVAAGDKNTASSSLIS
jgi:hypothetical protein